MPLLGETVTAIGARMGNPQCVVLGPLPDADRFNRLGPALSTHPMFPAGTNVEFAQVEAPDRVRILIWERGVGPTTSSGTGTSASAVAAAAHGGAARAIDVVAPGGTQRVEWREDGVYLTGWAEVVLEGDWTGRSVTYRLSLVRSSTSAVAEIATMAAGGRLAVALSIRCLIPLNRRSACA